MRRIALGVLCLSLTGCVAGRKSAAGFHLPDGNVKSGREAFVGLRCNACHQVAGVDLAAPVADPPVPVVLGGRVSRALTDGELAASIIDPSHRFAGGYEKDLIRSGKLSRMGDFSEAMTLRQLVDVVAFLQSTYEVQEPAAVGP